MSRYRIVIAPRARRQIHQIDDWWRHNRPAASELFQTELETALSRLSTIPTIGTVHLVGEEESARKLLLPRCRYHVYYDLDEERHEVQIVAVWHTARSRDPPLE